MRRRALLQGLAAFGGLALLPGGAGATAPLPPRLGPARGFSEEGLLAMAREIARMPYRPRPSVPRPWRDLTYDQYRSIWFKDARALWNGTDAGLRVDLLHPGLYFTRPVRVHAVENGLAREILFDLDLFERTDKVPPLPDTGALGFSGIRLRGELEHRGIFQEYAVFQGASYLRAIARGLIYGVSARALAVGTASPAGEEFPDLTTFWIERPGPGELPHRVHALLESPSVTGLYRFDLVPGEATEIAVSARLFPRTAIADVGIAPLTSMFYFDETNRGRFDDFRPAVHDSEGLAIHNGNSEALWRPLANPRQLQISAFVERGTGPRGFGLAQRARRFSDFADLEAKYHRRPSVWITPGEDWGPGAVVLVEIPTDREIFDNIVAFWRPRAPLAAGSEERLSYRMRWAADLPDYAPVARVLNTRIGRGFAHSPDKVVAIDFAPHPAIPADLSEIDIVLRASRGAVKGGLIQRNPETGGPRLAFRFDPAGAELSEIRAELRHQGRAISETWLYRWTA